MIILTKEDMQKVFSMEEAIEADKEALRLFSEGKSTVPLRTNIDVPEYEGQSLYMPAYVSGSQSALGVKIVSVYPNNIDKNLPSVPATMVVLNSKTGIVEAVMDGTYLTQLRTGAVQGAATDVLARKDAKVAALFGTGGQAITQLEAMLTVRQLEEVRIFDIDKGRCQKFVEEMSEEFAAFGTKMIAATSAEEAVAGADIITSATTSKRATFDGKFVEEGTHINGVGAYTPEMHEIPADIIVKADKVIFDTTEGVLAEAGDIITPLEEGLVERSHYQGDLGEVMLGKIAGRATDAEITVFKTVGTAVLDVVTAEKILQKAKKFGVGTTINM
ncbi:ornithine cyclodeaminase family protein [Carnobacterium antarcticum]|uniref:Ornithine cyclodeaminase family protein n=1 Tax=Carnobacterium antarcticum TaxID=2126436 RepID=A0ABW4NN51_9LACT|nr:ornithine cyclodeaminase family protein [Carnobacterium sp. CP1]ALV21463.1 Ornithine cyclodeaminase [Carnobacterium sp. CP1]